LSEFSEAGRIQPRVKKVPGTCLSLFICLWVLGAATGCLHPEGRIQVGIFNPPVESFDELAAAGFNLIVTAPLKESIMQAEKHQMAALVSPNGGQFDSEQDRVRVMKSLDRQKGLWGWYLYDEPDLHQESPQAIAELNRFWKRKLSKKTVLILSSGLAAEKYKHCADLLAVDWYPVPWAPIGTVVREMRLARLGTDDKPFLAIIQAFDWRFAQDLLRVDVALRPPTYDEIRSMSFLALMQGAKGVLFYAYKAAGWDIEKYPELKKGLYEIAAEIRATETIFDRRVSWWPVDTKTHGAPGEMYNEIMEARIAMALFEARSGSNAFPKGYYVVLANTTAEPTDFSFKLRFTDIRELKTYCAGTEFTAEEGWLRKMYGPHEVCIVGPIRREEAIPLR
jgi:hypothetical protein